MSSLTLNGDTSGSILIQAPAIAGNSTLTLPTTGGTIMAGGPAFSAYSTTTPALTAGVYLKLPCATEEFDTNSCYDTTNYRFTPNVAGYYMITGSVGVTTTAGSAIVEIYKNGAAFKQGGAVGASSTSYPYSTIAALVYLNGSTDYVELYVLSTVSGTQVWSGSSRNNYFQGFMVRGA